MTGKRSERTVHTSRNRVYAKAVREALQKGESIRKARAGLREDRWNAVLALLDAKERRRAAEQLARETEQEWVRTARQIEETWPQDREAIARSWMALTNRERVKVRARSDPQRTAEVETHACAMVEREREETTKEQMRQEAEKNENVIEAIGRGAGRVHRAACSGISTSRLARSGMSARALRKVRSIRGKAMSAAQVAEWIGVPRDEFQAWVHDDLVQCSYTVKVRIETREWVEEQVWTERDGERIKRSVTQIRRKSRTGPGTRRENEMKRAREIIEATIAQCGVEAEFGARIDRHVGEGLAWAQRTGAGRLDCTSLPLDVIDPEGAKDHDDAVHCEKHGDGWILSVAIADVACVVRPGTALDDEIRKRGQSVYLPDRVIAMCPETLSEKVCSLGPERDLRVLITRTRISRTGNARTLEAMRPATVRIARSMTYEEAQHRIDNGDERLETLLECARVLRDRRRRSQAVILETDTQTPVGRTADGRPRIGTPSERLDANWIIEEAMIETNVRNAKWLRRKHRSAVCYRSHPEPSPEAVAKARAIARQTGLRGSPSNAPRGFVHAVLKHNPERRWWAELCARVAMAKARYVLRAEPHFGLGEDHYAHTTSPIRRYADLIAQQAAHVVHGTKGYPALSHRYELPGHLDEREMAAVACERKCAERWTLLAVERDRTGTWMPGWIAGVREFGLFVEANEIPGVQGMVHVSSLGDEWWELVEHGKIRGRDSATIWKVGMQVRMRIESVDPEKGRMSVQIKTT